MPYTVDVSQELEDIKLTPYGKKMRPALHSSIEKLSKKQNQMAATFDSLIIDAGQSNAEVVAARVDAEAKQHASLKDRLDADAQEVINAREDAKTPSETHNNLKERLDSDYDYLNSEIEKTNTQLSQVENNKVSKGELVVNVKDYGAVGDGVTDDTSAIQVAVDVGGIIYFPRGIYNITDTINLNKSIVFVGEGWCGDTNLKDTTTTLLFNNTTQGKFMFKSTTPNHRFENITFKGRGYDISSDRRRWTKCFKFDKGTVFGDTDVEFVGCHFFRFCNCIELEGRGLLCSQNNFVETWIPIILKHFNNDEVANPPQNDWQSNIRGFRKFHFVDNKIHSCQGWFVSCTSTSNNNYEKHIHQVVLTGNRFDGTGGVWNGFIGGGVVSGNTIGKVSDSVYNQRIPVFSLLGCKQMTFVGNTIYSELDYSTINNRRTQLDDVFVFGQNLGDFQDIVITGNTIRHVGRRILKASQSSVYRLIFTSNNIYGVLLLEKSNTVSAIEFDGGANHIKIKDNIITNTLGVKHDKLINFSQRGVQNHDLGGNIFSSDEFAISNNAYAWNKNSNVVYSAYQGNGASDQTFTIAQNIDYVIITDVVNKTTFVKRAGSNLGNDTCEILDNSYTIKNTQEFNHNGTTYSVIIVCC